MAVLYRFAEGEWRTQADDYKGEKPKERIFPNYQLGQNGLIYGPQGSLRSSAKDLAIFAQVLLNGGTWKGKKILKKESVDLMLSKHWTYEEKNGDTWDNFFLSYGLGIHRTLNKAKADLIFPDRRMFGHPGIDKEYRSF